MAEKIIHSLIYDDHPIPKKSRALKERLKVPVGIALVLIFVSGLIYKYANYKEEGRVRRSWKRLKAANTIRRINNGTATANTL